MPTLTDDELKKAIADGKVFAISIDTSVFDAKQKTFSNTVLQRLDQFYERDVRVVFSDVVAREIVAHLRDDASETQRALKKALRSHTLRWNRERADKEDEDLLLQADPAAFAQLEFDAFLKHVNGQVIKSSDVPDAVENILTRYFSEAPPFGPADKRKSEFPDAFALLRLETFGEENKGFVLCVAPDKGWVEFAAKSDHLVCVDRLEYALALFNAADQNLADVIVQRWRESEGGEFIEAISNAFEYRLDDLDFSVDGHADVEFEAEPLGAVLQVVNPQSIGQPTVIAVDSDTVTFTVGLEACVGFEASFNFFVEDSVDRDYVHLGSEETYIEDTLPFTLTITADRSLDDGVVFHEVEVSKKRIDVNFGYVDAFPNENPHHEKY